MAGALTPEQRHAVNRIYGSESNAIDEAVRRSEELAGLWEEGQSLIAWPNQREFRELWWPRALPVLGIGAAPPDAEAAPEPEVHPLPELPAGVNFYKPATIRKAVSLFADDMTRNDVANEASLQAKDATRVRNLKGGGLLRLNKQGKLVVDPSVGQRGGEIALRYLGPGRRWLDPHRDPPLPAAGGSA